MPPVNVLDQRRLDLEREDSRKLVKLLAGAYGNRDEAMAVLKSADVDLQGLEARGSTALFWRQALEAAAMQGRLRRVAAAVLADEERGELHQDLRLLDGDMSTQVAAFNVLDPPQPGPLPPLPWPLWEPITDGRVFGGRDEELDALDEALGGDHPVVLLVGPRGAGRTSLLRAGLTQRLRAQGRPVAFADHVLRSSLARRLLLDMIASDKADLKRVVPPAHFASMLEGITEQAGRVPVLMLDDVHQVLDSPEHRNRLASLLTAVIDKNPVGPWSCVWVLSCDAAHTEELERFVAETLEGPPNADPSRDPSAPVVRLEPLGAGPEEAAVNKLVHALNKPLEQTDEQGEPWYIYRFAHGEDERLARAVTAALRADPPAPLYRPMQWMLYRAMVRADDVEGEELSFPDDLESDLPHALERFLSDSLAPLGDRAAAAWLTLVRLVDEQGQPTEPRPTELIRKVLGDDAQSILDHLSAPGVDLLRIDKDDQGIEHATLTMPAFAHLLFRIHSDPELEDRWAPSAGRELIQLRRVVVDKSNRYARAEPGGLRLDPERTALLTANRRLLLRTREEQQWLKELLFAQHRAKKLKRSLWIGLALLLGVAGAWWALARHAG